MTEAIQDWPFSGTPSPRQLLDLYSNGFVGAPCDPANAQRLFDERIVRPFSEAAPHLAGTGAGKRAALWMSREKYDPGAYGQESQTTGDCTSHGDRNCRDTVRSVEIHIKGEPEEYFKRGATEPTYGARGHGGQGMDPARAAEFVTRYGFMVRQNYPGVVDLSRYNASIGAGWGRRGVPEAVRRVCGQHPVGEWTMPRTITEAMDLMANGYCCHSGQNVGFRSSPDSRGIHRRSGSWSHDMATCGYDDTMEVWDELVFFVPNSWGRWNEQWSDWPRNLLGPPVTGMIVCDAETWERHFLGGRSIYFYSDIKGFPSKTLPDYGTQTYL